MVTPEVNGGTTRRMKKKKLLEGGGGDERENMGMHGISTKLNGEGGAWGVD